MASGSLQTPEVDGPTDSVGQQLPSWNCAPQCAQVSLPRGAPEIESRGGIIPNTVRLGAFSFRRYAAVCWAIQFPSWQQCLLSSATYSAWIVRIQLSLEYTILCNWQADGSKYTG